MFPRASGILLHPSSLPGKYGIGDLGRTAYDWLDFLGKAGCGLWQVLPLGPTGYGDSPYQSFSSFAGNPYLISPEELVQSGLLLEEDLTDRPDFLQHKVDYGPVIEWKVQILDLAYQRFLENQPEAMVREYQAFQTSEANWLPDFALFMALKDLHEGAPWVQWEPDMRDRVIPAVQGAREEHAGRVATHTFRQFLFWRQWRAVRERANALGIRVVGDVPIFVAHDSADVWANRELFYLDAEGQPTVVAGVPPDYFSTTGQLWGNPLYRWDVHRATGYRWWVERLTAVLKMVDIIRLDHFRGFAGYWEVPGGAETAEKGRWAPGPGSHFFYRVREELGELPLIAEDLGEITPDVDQMREEFNLPGMKILQFAFEGDKDFLPHNYPFNCVAYTGTHDNNTSRGWYENASPEHQDFARRYMGVDGNSIAWSMIQTLWRSVAMFAIAPMQDFLSLGEEMRMNYPGRPSGNWGWRMPEDALRDTLWKGVRDLNWLYERLNEVEVENEEEAREALREEEWG